MLELQQNTTSDIPFYLKDSSGHAVTGKTPTVSIGKALATPATPAGSVSEIGAGWYKLHCTTADTGTLGLLSLTATASGAQDAFVLCRVVDHDPADLGSISIESGFSLRGVLRLMSAVLAGVATVNANKTSILFRDLNNLKNRVTAAVDVRGNRLTVTHDQD